MKNRFYYSKKQDNVIGDMQQFDIFHDFYDEKKNYIKTDDGIDKRYTQWCSSENSICNWEDAVLVFESDESRDDLFKRIARR